MSNLPNIERTFNLTIGNLEVFEQVIINKLPFKPTSKDANNLSGMVGSSLKYRLWGILGNKGKERIPFTLNIKRINNNECSAHLKFYIGKGIQYVFFQDKVEKRIDKIKNILLSV